MKFSSMTWVWFYLFDILWLLCFATTTTSSFVIVVLPGSITSSRASSSSLSSLFHMAVADDDNKTTQQRMDNANIQLPPAPPAAANYVPCQKSGNLLYLSGHMPLKDDGSLMTGRIENSDDIDRGYQAARQVGLNLIATLNKELDGNLDQVEQIVKLFGIVQCSDEFNQQHLVINGCSDLMIEVFGNDKGVHARSAIGTNALPLDLTVEIEAIVRTRIKPECIITK